MIQIKTPENEAGMTNRKLWFEKLKEDEELTKPELRRLYILSTLRRTVQMFKYTGLPETIPARNLELIIQQFRFAVVTKVNGKLYCFWANLGGSPDVYYEPTTAIIANPALNYSATLKIDEDCVVIRNDSCWQGLMPAIRRYAYLAAENDISFKFALWNARIPAFVSATDGDQSKDSAQEMFQHIVDGDGYGVVVDDAFEKQLKSWPFTNNNAYIKDLIELRQYISGTFWQDLGIQAPFNMKREAINEAEAALSTDILFPSTDDMLKERQIAVDKINKMFGTNITVEFNSTWKQLRINRDLAIEKEKSEINKNNDSDKVEVKEDKDEQIE